MTRVAPVLVPRRCGDNGFMKPLTNTLLFSTLFILAIVISAGAQAKTGYHLVDTISVGGDGGWDGLVADADAHRLYVSHATKVVVIDTATDKVIGEIPNTNGVHCIVLAEKFGKGYTTNGR